MSTIIKLQAKQEEKHTSAINTVLPVLNECYSILRGHGFQTDALDSKYEVSFSLEYFINFLF